MERVSEMEPREQGVMPYRDPAKERRVSWEGVVGFGVAASILPGMVVCGACFNAGVAFMVMFVGSLTGLSLGLASMKEVRESEGRVYGMAWAALAIGLSLFWPVMLVGLLVLTAVMRGMFD
jgi:hypothetical protein